MPIQPNPCDELPPTPPERRRPLQFGLRAILIATTLLAIVFAASARHGFFNGLPVMCVLLAGMAGLYVARLVYRRVGPEAGLFLGLLALFLIGLGMALLAATPQAV